MLAVGAHPDDVEIGAAGALLAHRAAGHEIAILTMSRGARGGPDEARAGESRRAAAILGASLYLEDMEDTRISESDPTISAISAVIEKVQPTIVYTHSIHDVHQDHRNTHRAVMVAAREVGSVFCYQSPSATVDFRPARFIAIDEHLTVKLAAIGAFASQASVRPYLAPDLIEATARYWSRFGSGRFAEAFEVVRDHAAGPVPGTPGLAAATPREAAETQHALQEAAVRKAADQEAAELAAAVAENAPHEQAAQQALPSRNPWWRASTGGRPCHLVNHAAPTRRGQTSVLVTGAGGPAAIAVMKSLRADASVTLLAADMDRLGGGAVPGPARRPRGHPGRDRAGLRRRSCWPGAASWARTSSSRPSTPSCCRWPPPGPPSRRPASP